ncbi:DNL zinc finger-domain-containing protein [Chlamydoabsidia padenii]|nr:DNL zinc finger-domain-containing protein [Chlamydoabsidia padenii]
MLRSILRQCRLSSTLRHYQTTVNNTPFKTVISKPLLERNIFPLVSQQRHLHVSQPWWHESSNQEPQVVDPKHQLLIGFTCQVCQVRSHHLMSKQAYTKGVVLIQCPDCKNRHLIADNLGWFQDSKTNVEDLVKEKGEAVRKVVVDEQGNRLPVEHLMEWLPQITAEEEDRIQAAKDKAAQLKSEKDDV